MDFNLLLGSYGCHTSFGFDAKTHGVPDQDMATVEGVQAKLKDAYVTP